MIGRFLLGAGLGSLVGTGLLVLASLIFDPPPSRIARPSPAPQPAEPPAAAPAEAAPEGTAPPAAAPASEASSPAAEAPATPEASAPATEAPEAPEAAAPAPETALAEAAPAVVPPAATLAPAEPAPPAPEAPADEAGLTAPPPQPGQPAAPEAEAPPPAPEVPAAAPAVTLPEPPAPPADTATKEATAPTAPAELADATPAAPALPEGPSAPQAEAAPAAPDLPQPPPLTAEEEALIAGLAPPPGLAEDLAQNPDQNPPEDPAEDPAEAETPAPAGAVGLEPAPSLPGEGTIADDPARRLVLDSQAEASPPVAEPAEAPAIPTDRLPRIGDAADEPDGAAEPPLARYARAFENPAGKPLIAVILIDTGEAGLDRTALAALPFPVTFALDPLAEGAAGRAAIYRAAGQEVVMLAAGLPQGAVAADVEQAFQIMDQALPEAVAVMDPPQGGFQGDRTVAAALVPVVGAQGRGLVTWDQGLNAADQVARREDVPAAVAFRNLDGEGESTPVIRRYLDRAAFKAAQEGRVLVVGQTRPETVQALLEWTVEGRAATVALAPVSAVLATD